MIVLCNDSPLPQNGKKWGQSYESESGKVEITKSHLAKNEANLVNRKLKKRNEKKNRNDFSLSPVAS